MPSHLRSVLSLPSPQPHRSLFFDCVVTSCGHRYCAGCIRDARDCPACGADITSLAPDPQTQGGFRVAGGGVRVWVVV